jgi:pimeloyl-ACP methyl ester carboxylesterase
MSGKAKSPGSASGEDWIALGDCSLHIRTSGTASELPAVVLESGCGSTLGAWDSVERHLGSQLRVFCYERAGVGSSKGRGAGAAVVAERLAALLDAARIDKPVILVGHSLGGLYARYFAATRPQHVAGLVLIDATPENLTHPRELRRKAVAMSWGVYLIARTGLLPLVARLYEKRPLSPQLKTQLKAAGTAHHVRASMDEFKSIPQIQKEVVAYGPPAGLPVLVISAGTREAAVNAEMRDILQRSHEQLPLLGLAPWSGYHLIPGATHMGLLSNAAHAETVGKLILDFARQIPRHPGSASRAHPP